MVLAVSNPVNSSPDSLVTKVTSLAKFNSYFCIYKGHLSDFSISSQSTLDNFIFLWKTILYGFEHRVQVLICTFYLKWADVVIKHLL